MSIQIKVCGMREEQNILEVAALGPAMMGFIFYAPSPRYAGALNPRVVRSLKGKVARAGVFVDHSLDEVLETAGVFELDYIQLHGSEPPAYVESLRGHGMRIIKTFDGNLWSPETLRSYQPHVDMFLFDTKTRGLPGGTGKKFQWEGLGRYELQTPFLLGGGIGPGDAQMIKRLALPMLKMADLNSGFETAPGLKDAAGIRRFQSNLV